LPVCLERTLEAEYMLLRECRQSDLPALIDLTIEAFRPFFEGDLPEVLDPRVFAHDHGNWKEKYRAEVPALHDANSNRFIILAEDSERPLGYVGWQVNTDGSGRLRMVAVHPQARRRGVGSAV
jgi:ribosomal protein S18 acetylase RimI-like enzyme